MAPPKDGASLQGGAAALDERKRVLFHASSLNRSDIISKVVSNNSSAPAVGVSPSSSTSKSGEIDREVLDHVDEGGLTALHHAVKKSSLDVSVALPVGFLSKYQTRDIYTNLHTCANGSLPSTRYCRLSTAPQGGQRWCGEHATQRYVRLIQATVNANPRRSLDRCV